MIQIALRLGANPLPGNAGIAMVACESGSHEYIVAVIREGRECGTFKGTVLHCETWLDGYLQAWFSRIGVPK